MKWFKRIVLLLVALAVAAGLVLAFQPRPVAVDTALVTKGRYQQSIEEDGKTRVKERYTVSSPLSGTLERIALHAGDAVDDGTVLATIQPVEPPLLDARSRRELSARLAASQASRLRAQTSVEAARATADYAKRNLARTRALAKGDAIAETELERVELEKRARDKELEAAEFGARVARHEVEMARAALAQASGTRPGQHAAGEKWQIRSPVHGVVLRVLHESAGVVNAGTPLLELADPAALEVVVDVLSTDAVEIPHGAPVRIERWGGPRPLVGRVRLVEPSATTRLSALGVEEQRVNTVIDLLSPHDQWKALGDGFRVEARITTFEKDGAVKLPASALFRDDGAWAVYLVEGDRARKKKVQISRRSGTEAMVQSGVAPGDRVVVYPGDAVKDGTRIELR